MLLNEKNVFLFSMYNLKRKPETPLNDLIKDFQETFTNLEPTYFHVL